MEENRVLSVRCQTAKTDDVKILLKYQRLYEADQYHKETNPNGIINLATSVNGIHAELVKEKFLSQDLVIGSDAYHYFPTHGIPRLQKAMADYLTTFFETSHPVQPDNIYFMTSAISVFDTLAHCLADPGDVFMSISPVYSGVAHGFGTRSHVEVWPIPLSSQSEVPFSLSLRDVEESYMKALEAGKKVRGLVLLNPGNPIGSVAEADSLQDILKFCHKHTMHFVSDEVYAMSVHDPEVNFHSILKLPLLPDPNRTHLVYGISKDLGLTKLRMGVLHTFNKDLQNHLKLTANLHCVSYPIMELVANILEDKEWCKSLFYKSREMLRERYLSLSRKLESLSLKVHPTSGAVFFWVNFKKYCQPLTFESEELLFSKLFQEAKLVIFPGALFGSSEPGWFRVVFALEENTMLTGMQRLEEFLNTYK